MRSECNFFQPKSKEELQAQAELFADKGVPEFSDEQRQLLTNASSLAAGNIPEGMQEIVEDNRQKYLELLRRSSKEEIVYRKENIENYNSRFKEAIDSLREKISQTEYPESLPEYLGSGANGIAFEINVDGCRYAAKFSRSVAQANFEIKPLLIAKGIKNAAQLVAYSFDDNVVIMDLLHGRDVSTYYPNEDPGYTDQHIIALIDTVLELYENGLVIDPKPSNFLFDNEEGFSVLDFHILREGTTSIGDIVLNLRIALTTRKWPLIHFQAADFDREAEMQNIERNIVYLRMMIRFLKILKENYPLVLEDYNKHYQEREQDPKCHQSPLIDRDKIPQNNQQIQTYLHELESMGF